MPLIFVVLPKISQMEIRYTRNRGADAPLFLALAEGFEDSWHTKFDFYSFSASLQKKLIHLEHSFFDFWFWGFLGVIFEFLNFLKMPFLIFFILTWVCFLTFIHFLPPSRGYPQTNRQTNKQTFQNTDSVEGWVIIIIMFCISI